MPHRITNKTNTIGENSSFEGKIKLDGTIRIDGLFKGENLAIQHLIIGKTGIVKSDINADSIVVEGVISGDIFAKIRAMFLPTAKISGNITTPELIIQNGVVLEGNCRISSSPDINISELVNSYIK